MKKMLRISLCILMATAFAAQAQEVFDIDFSGYSDGNITNNAGWVANDGSTWNIVGGELVLAREAQGNKLMLNTGTNIVAGATLKVTLDQRFRIPNDRRHARVMTFGVQTNGVEAIGGQQETVSGFIHFWGAELSRESGQVRWTPQEQSWWNQPGTIGYTLRAFEDLGFNPFGYDTNSGTDIATVDPDSDVLRLVYTMTKSHVSNQFYVACSTSNLTSGVQWDSATELIERTGGAWESDDYYFFVGANPEASTDFTNYIQNVKMEVLPPVVAPPATVSALALDGEIQVSWAVAPGATYDLYRSLTSGSGFSLIAPDLTEEEYLDTPLPNGTEQFYYVIAKFGAYGDSVASAEASAIPQGIFKDQLVYSHDFESNPLGDLASNDPDWIEVAGSSNNAFAVVNNGDNELDTVTVSNDFDNVVGNAVYLDTLIQNNQDDVISGSFDIVISCTALNGTNANFTHQGFFNWGMTTSTSEAPDVDKDMMAQFLMTMRFENRLVLKFGEEGNSETTALIVMPWNELGWNPKPVDAQPNKTWIGDPAAPIDLVTEPLHVEWQIRKTREDGVYQAWAAVTNLTSGVGGTGNVTYKTQTRQTIYDVPAALFSMGHYFQSKLDTHDDMLHVQVDDVSITHESGIEPDVIAPTITSVIAGDREVSFSWDSVFEATGGYKVEITTPDMETYVLADGTTDLSFTDAPRWNDITNTYTVTSIFDGDLSPNTASSSVDASPVGLVTVYHLDEGFGSANMTSSQPIVDDGNWMYIDGLTTPLFENGEGGYTGPSIYGVMQGAQTNGVCRAEVGSNGGKLHFGLADGWELYPYGAKLAFVDVSNMVAETSFDAIDKTLYVKARWGGWFSGNTGDANNGCRVAIRNGTQWYVSDSLFANGGAGGQERTVTVGDVADESWRTLTVNTTSEMIFSGTAESGLNLTNINAIGWFANRFWSCGVYELEVKQQGALPSYDYWVANSTDLVSSNNAPELDPDGDGIINEREYAFNGDPLDENSPAAADLPTYVFGAGDMTAIYREQRDPVSGISYSLKSTGNLPAGSWNPVGTTSEGVIDYYWKAVTNVAPYSGGDAEFYRVDVN